MTNLDGDLWDRATLHRLRAGETDVLLERRSLAPVLQQAGQALLRAGSAADINLVRRCVAGLRERDAAGDDILAVELLAEFGEPSTSEHVSWPLSHADAPGRLKGHRPEREGREPDRFQM